MSIDIEHPSLASSIAGIFHNAVTAWIVLAASTLVTLAGWHIASKSVSQRAADRFVFEVNTSVQAITKRMQEYEQVLRGGVGLFMASEHVDRKEFQTYVANLLIDTYWPGIQGIGYAQMISPDSLTAHEKSIRSEGFPDYMVYPPGERDVYSAIVYLEPFTSRNQRAFGYDMFSNPIRKEAMQKAAETGQPAVSGLVTLVQETSTDIQAGFLVYLPLYSVDKPLATEEERWRLLKGFVYAPFRAKDLFQGILGEGPPTLDFQVFDGDQPLTDHLLYDSRQDTLRRDEGGQHQSQRVIALQGRAWTLQFKSTQTFDQLMGSTQPTIIATTGLIIDILLFVVIYTMARNRENAVQRTKEITLLVEGLSSSEQRLKRTHEIAKLGSWQYDLKRKKFGCSDQAYRILELATDAPINYKRYMEVIHPDDREKVNTAWNLALSGRPFNIEHRILIGQQIKWVSSRAYFKFDENNEPYFVEGSLQDITERKQSEQSMKLSAQVIEFARESIVITDENAVILDVNPMFTEMTGYRKEEVVGKTPSYWSSGKHDKKFFEDMWEKLESSGIWEGEIWNARKDGSLFLQHVNISAVKEADSNKVNHYVSTASDITEAYEQRKRLEHLALHDPLTGLPNRHLLFDRITVALAQARRTKNKVAAAFIDLDGFKQVNDKFGHALGDELLQQVAQRLTHTVREEDTVSRVGGDEFCLLFTAPGDQQELANWLERTLRELSRPFEIGGRTMRISGSIGVAYYPTDASTLEELIAVADERMYVAKEKGKNQIIF